MKVGYLGPPGTFSEEAACRYLELSGGGEAIPCRSLKEIAEVVAKGRLDEGVVPLENSYEGSVNLTLDLLAGGDGLQIRGEVIVPVCCNLLARPGIEAKELTCITSHPQPLGQCREFIEKNFPGVVTRDASSTSEAARLVAESPEPWGAIGAARAAGAYGLAVLAAEINDRGDNATRFVVLGREDRPVQDNCKTSIVVSATDRPGALYRILKEFALHNINLTRIESRPAKRKLGEYLFFIDFQGSRRDPEVTDALKEVQEQAASFKNLGSYAADAAYLASDRDRRMASLSIEEIRADIDIIDFQVIELLGKRTELVSSLAGLKKSAGQVRDPAREEAVLGRVREIARKKGFDPGVTEEIYRILFRHFVGLQEASLAKGE
ncbi:MAG: prephenate dehydratase [Eubacteriales bacterium]